MWVHPGEGREQLTGGGPDFAGLGHLSSLLSSRS